MKNLLNRFSDVQLATLVDSPPQGENWIHEIKFDGYRLLGFLDQGEVRLYTRNGNDWTDRFPSITASIKKLKARSAVIDMEAVITEESGRTSFQALQNALGEGGGAGAIVAYVFDLLHLDGKDITQLPQVERKTRLEALLKKSTSAKALFYSQHIEGVGTEMLARSCTLGLEGIVSKLADAPYTPGRQKSWLKSKCITRQEFVILGFSDPKSGGRAIGALYLGYVKNGKMSYAGKVGTGFSMKDATDIYAKLARIETKTPSMDGVPKAELRFIRWVKPSLLCEVAFVEWTEDGHIRHGSFQGLRLDKKPKEVTRETPEPVEKAVSEIKAKPDVAKVKKGNGKIEIGSVGISHGERVIDPASGTTKAELAEYYAAVAPYILRSVAGHPLTVIRCPDGIDGEIFYQRNPARGLGPDVIPFTWHYDAKNKEYDYFYIKKPAGLMEMVQMNAIEFHPWGTRYNKMDYPDRAVFDLDPDTGVPFEAVKLGALDLKQRLENMGLRSFLKCTGGKGLHIIVPLAEKDRWPDVKAWCSSVAHQMVEDSPGAYVATMTKAKRTGKIFIDFFRNDYTATAVSDFSVRARPGLPVAVPLEWKEIKSLQSASQFMMADVLKRLKKTAPDDERYKLKQRIPKK
ncbi:MAG: dependent ligase [Micavibrio sp.]|nr:dependent ligase [Micavibrio sp.]